MNSKYLIIPIISASMFLAACDGVTIIDKTSINKPAAPLTNETMRIMKEYEPLIVQRYLGIRNCAKEDNLCRALAAGESVDLAFMKAGYSMDKTIFKMREAIKKNPLAGNYLQKSGFNSLVSPVYAALSNKEQRAVLIEKRFISEETLSYLVQ